jgi:hypothetical protein
VAVIAQMLTAVALALAAPAATDPVDQAAKQLDGSPGVYVAPGAVGHPLTRAQAGDVDATVQAASTPVFVAALGESTRAQELADLRRLVDRVGRQGTYIVVWQRGYDAASDVAGVEGEVSTFEAQAKAAHPGDPAAVIDEFIRLADSAASSAASDGSAPDSGSGPESGSPPVPGATRQPSSSPRWLPLVVLLALGAGLVGLFRRGAARRRRAAAAELAEVRSVAEQDVTALGEQVTALDVPPAAAPEAVEDYRLALDAYDRAKSALSAARRTDDVRAVTTALEEGRWRLACVRARLAGQPLPERRPPCFFNPQHGPSTTDVEWSPAGGATRTIPVCAADAARLARGDDPDERLVPVGASSVPYWQAPGYYRPYASGFFGGWGGGSFLSGLLLGEVLTGGLGGWGAYDAGAYDAGYSAGFDAGGAGWGDAGGGGDFASGFDVGGGGWGGGADLGGGDFGGGGGDFGGGGGDFGGGGGDGGGW